MFSLMTPDRLPFNEPRTVPPAPSRPTPPAAPPAGGVSEAGKDDWPKDHLPDEKEDEEC